MVSSIVGSGNIPRNDTSTSKAFLCAAENGDLDMIFVSYNQCDVDPNHSSIASRTPFLSMTDLDVGC